MTEPPRCYTIAQILERVHMNRRTFFHLRKVGQLPWLEEIRPRAGRYVRYRADLVDRYVAGQWTGPRAVRRMA
jgi:hypothetical protein